MPTNFPTLLDEFSNPSGADAQSSAPVLHSTQHVNANDAIEALQAKVGVDGSTDPDSLDYKIAHFDPAPSSTDAVEEGSSNLYFTYQRVCDTVLTALSTATNTAITATDTLLAALGKLQAQVTNKVDKEAGKGLSKNDYTDTEKTKLTGIEAGANAYTHPAQHAPSIIAQDAGNRFTTDAEKAIWNGKLDASAIGNTAAPLVDGFVPSANLPSYVDDVIEASTFASLPATGESGKIYVLDTPYTAGGITSSQFRWSGSAYAPIIASPGTTDAVTEGATNLYFTVARVRATVLTGLSLATNAAITATDSVLSALGKLQKQITDYVNAKDASDGYAGLSLFKLNLKNAAGTITSWLTSAATVARTWTFPDKDGTVAMLSDITGTNSGVNTGDETAASIKTKLGITTLSGSNTGDQTLSGLGGVPAASPSTSGTLTHSGDIVLSGSGKRITGDFSNATLANRLMFKSSAANASTGLGVIPNGTAGSTSIRVFASSDPDNTNYGQIAATSAQTIIASGKTGAGSYKPLVLNVGGVDYFQLSPAGLLSGINGGGIAFTQAGTGAATITSQSKMQQSVSVTDFYANGSSGVPVDPTGVVDSTAGIQAAIDYVGGTLFGGKVYFPAGIYKVSSTINIPYDCITLVGDGQGASGHGTGVEENSQTLILTTAVTGNIFNFTCDYGGTIQDMCIRSSVTRTAGAGIAFSGASGGTYNAYSSIRNVTIQGTYDGISDTSGCILEVDGCFLLDHERYGVDLANPNAPDAGDQIINNCFFISSGFINSVHIHQSSAGGLKVSSSKFLHCRIAYRMELAAGVSTSDLLFSNCSIENYTVGGIYLSNPGLTGAFFNVVVSGCQFMNGPGATGLTIGGSVNWLQNITISGNAFNSGDGGFCLNMQTSKNVSITGNSFDGSGSNTAILLGGVPTQVIVSGNAFNNFTSNVINAATSGVLITGNVSDKQPQTIASVDPLVLPDEGEFFKVSGTTNFSGVLQRNQHGRRVSLMFTEALIVVNSGALFLAGGVFSATANDILNLICDGTNWIETGRSVN